MENKISIRLKTLRKQLSLSAKQVITLLSKANHNYSLQTLYKWEEGSVIPNLNALKELSKIYGCNISYLMDGENFEYKRLSPSENYLLNIYRTDFLFRSLVVQVIHKLSRDTNI